MDTNAIVWCLTCDARAGSYQYKRKTVFNYIYQAHQYAMQLEKEGCFNVKIEKTTMGEYLR